MDASEQTYQKFRQAIALTESSDNPRLWGDNGLACGRYQQHPAFMQRWIKDFNCSDRTSWDDLFEACLRNFFNACAPPAKSPTELAVWYNMHGGPGPGWNAQYAFRFDKFYGTV